MARNQKDKNNANGRGQLGFAAQLLAAAGNYVLAITPIVTPDPNKLPTTHTILKR
jgi:hypothetical protein